MNYKAKKQIQRIEKKNFNKFNKFKIEKDVKIYQNQINMNLPAINIKMKNHNNQFNQANSSGMDGFGLGIQVFKIESVKNMDSNFKSRNRTAIKNIENPTQTTQYKAPIIPKPKILPSLQKSHSQINAKQRLSAYISSKIESGTPHNFTDKIADRKQPYTESNTIVTSVSYSMRKRTGLSTQKSIPIPANQTAKPFHVKNVPTEKQRIPTKAITAKLNQTAPPQMMYKPQQLYFVSYQSQNEVLNKFYQQFQNCQKQCIKQLKQLKKLKETQIDQQIYYKIQYLQSLQGRVQSVIENMERQQFEEKNKQLAKFDQKRPKKMINNIVPITGFEMSQYETFEEDSIEHYYRGDYCGSFKINNFENVDLAPVTVQPKDQSQDDD